MGVKTRTVLKTYFNTGDTPTEAQFIDLIDTLPVAIDDIAATTTATSITFNAAPAVIPTAVGGTYWDVAARCLATVTGTNTTIQHGQELPILCKNDDGAILNGQPVRIVAGTGNIPRINFASASSESTSYLIGIATEDIAASPNGTGMVSTYGLVNDVTISLVAKTGETGANWIEGLPVFLSTETGKLTVTKPPAPNHGNFVGSIMNRTGGDGVGAKCTLFVHPTLGAELDELHDVLITSPAAGNLIQRNATNTIWENKTLAQAGITSLHGFENQTDTSLPTPYTGSNIFTLTRVNDYSVYFNGIKSTFTASKPIDIGATTEWIAYTADQRKGQWFVWMNSDGSLGASRTPWVITNVAYTPIATNHWDGTEWIPSEERHGIDRNLLWHSETHKNYGAAYQSGFTSSPTFDAGSANTFSFVGGTTSDEGLLSVTSGAQTACRLGYRVTGGASMTWEASAAQYAKVIATKVQYDNNGTLADIPNGDYGIFWIYQTNRMGATNKLTSIVGQAWYGTLALAQAGSQPTLAGLSVAEWKCIYKVIVKVVANGTSWGYDSFVPQYNLSTGPAISGGSPVTMPAVNVTEITDGNVQTAIDNLRAASGSGSVSLSRLFMRR